MVAEDFAAVVEDFVVAVEATPVVTMVGADNSDLQIDMVEMFKA